MRAAIISFTEAGDKLGEQIACGLNDFDVIRTGKNCNRRSESLADWTSARFGDSALIVFIGAVGIAVRACAPYIVSKRSDPAVIAADEKGRYVIPILSGHIGGANGYARMIAAHIGADAVITTATDINGCFAADEWAVKNGLCGRRYFKDQIHFLGFAWGQHCRTGFRIQDKGQLARWDRQRQRSGVRSVYWRQAESGI